MSRKGLRAAARALSVALPFFLFLPNASAAIQSKTAAGLVVPDQGIMPDSAITEVLEIRVAESDTRSATSPVDDGAAHLQSLTARIIPASRTARDLVADVAVYRILQPLDAPGFDFDRDFDFSLNRLLVRREVADERVVLDLGRALPSPDPAGTPGDEILNTTAVYFVAVTTTSAVRNEEQFSVEVSGIRLAHPSSSDPDPELAVRSLPLRCVVSVGDLTPVADFIDPAGNSVEYPLGAATLRSLPHNYPDYAAVHPDALNTMRDLEIPVVHPAESGLFPVLGIELAGVRSELSAVVVNFVSVVEGRNDDLDAWMDEPGGTPGAFDPAYDEIFRDQNRNGKYDAGDTLLFAGANGIPDFSRLGVDDDMDGLTDEERPNGERGPLPGAGNGNDDRDYYVDENASGRYEPTADEFYRDVDNDGLFSGTGNADQIVDLDGSRTPDPGTLLDRESIRVGDPLTAFRAADTVAYQDTDQNGLFDPAVDTMLHDYDLDRRVTIRPDLFVDGDGSATRGAGNIDIRPGRAGTPFALADRLLADEFTAPQVVFLDKAPTNGAYDQGEPVLLGDPSATAPAGTYRNVAEALSVVWTYADDGDLAYDDGEDVWINVVPAQLVFSDRRDDEGVILGEAASLAELDSLTPASGVPGLAYFDVLSPLGRYTDGEDIYLETVPGRTYTDPTVVEGIRQGAIGGFSLRAGQSFETGGAIPLIDEDVNVSYSAELIDEDLRDTWFWVDSDGNGMFDVIDIDGDRDFAPDEDVNGNGILDRRDNNGDGDFDDEEDYTEDLNGDGNLDLGVSGNDELYFDYDGDRVYDAQVGGQEIDLDENVYAGADGRVTLRPGEAYPRVFSIDEDGDGERAPDGTIPPSARAPVSVFGLQPGGGPYIMANGVDDDGDGLTDEGINEDLGDDAFDAFTVRTHHDLVRSNDYFISDVERLHLYRDNGDGVFDPAFDTPISRDDPEARDWQWVRVDPPVYTAVINVDTRLTGDEALRRVPRTDGKNYDFFLVMSLDGDDEGDVFPEFAGASVPDGLGVRYGDDFIVTLAPGGIRTDAGFANEGEATKVQECLLYIDDVIGFTGSDIQADDNGVSAFTGNPYLDPNSSPIPVLGIDFTNSAVFPAQGGGVPSCDAIEQVRVHVRGVTVDQVSGAEDKGIFDIRIGDAVDNDGDGQIDEDPDNGVDDDRDGLTDEDGGPAEGAKVTVPDLKQLAADSTGGVALFRDDDTPAGDGIDNDGDGRVDEELVNGLDDDLDGLVDEDVGDGDPAGTNGVFDPWDDPLPLRDTALSPLSFRLEDPAAPENGVFVDLSPVNGAVALPDDAGSTTRGYDYFVVVRSSGRIEYRDSFRVSIGDQDVRFRSGRSAQNSGAAADPISANVPVFLTDLTAPGQTIGANSGPEPVIGLNLHDRNPLSNRARARLDYIVVSVLDTGGDNDFSPSDLLPLTTFEDLNGNGMLDVGEDLNGDGILNSGFDSGIAIYRDEPGSLTNGGFDDPADPNLPAGKTDSLVYLSGGEYFGNLSGFPNSVLLKIDPLGLDPGDRGGRAAGETVPPGDTGDDASDDYFLVIRTSDTIADGDDFRVVVAPISPGDRVQWPLHFLPVLRNGVFDYASSYVALETNPITANTRFETVLEPLVLPADVVEPGDAPLAAVGINVQDGGSPNVTLAQVRVQLFPGEPDIADDDVESGFQVRDDGEPHEYLSDLRDFTGTADSGLSVFEDANGNGEFDPGVDRRLDESSSTYQVIRENGVLRRVEAVINLNPGGAVPDNDLGASAGPDFFVVVSTSPEMSYGDTFSIRIPAGGLGFQPGAPLASPAATAGPVRAGVPVTFSDQTGVFGGAVGENSEPLPAIGLNLNIGRNLNDDPVNPTFVPTFEERLVGLDVRFNDEGGFATDDIAPLLANSAASGLALYRDSDQTGDPQYFDLADFLVPMSPPFAFAADNTAAMSLLDPARDGVLPRSDVDPDSRGPDYFVVFRTSDAISYYSRFSITVRNLRFLTSTSTSESTTATVTASLVSRPPEVELLTPEPGASVWNEPFIVRWNDSDPDSNASLSLFRISVAEFESQVGVPLSNLQGVVPIPGAQDMPEDPDGEADTFSWDVREVPPGDYIVIARITDGRVTAFGRSPGSLAIVNQPPAFAFTNPDRENDTVIQGFPFTIEWSGSDPENAASTTVVLALDDDLSGNPDPLPRITIAGPSEGLRLPDAAFTFDTLDLPAGAYFVIAEVSNPANGTLTFNSAPNRVVIVENDAPWVTAVQVLRDGRLVTAGEPIPPVGNLSVTWQDEDEDDNARLSILVGTEPGGFAGTPADGTYIGPGGEIFGSTDIPEDDLDEGLGREIDAFAWDVSGLGSGTYHLFIEITDGIHTDRAYFTGPDGITPVAITINHPPEFRFVEPDGLNDTVIQGQPFVIRWEDGDPDNSARIELSIFTLGEQRVVAAAVEEDDDTDSFTLETGSLANVGKTAIYVIAKVEDGVQPEPLYVQSRGPITVLRNRPPRITVTRPALERPAEAPDGTPPGEPVGAVAFGGRYEIAWTLENDDEGLVRLYYDTDNTGLDGTLINTDGPVAQSSGRRTYVWDLAASGLAPGTYWIYAVVEDAASAAADYADGPLTVAEPETQYHFGGVVLDSGGRLNYVDPVPAAPALPHPWGGFCALLRGRGGRSYLLIGRDATVTAIGEYPLAGIKPGGSVLFSSSASPVVDAALSPDEEWVYLLHENGGISVHGAGAANPFLRTHGVDLEGPYAAALELTRSGRGAYVLDRFGGVVALGDAPVLPGPYFADPRAVDLTVVEGGYYILTSLGELFGVGSVPTFTAPAGLAGIVAMDAKDHGGIVLLDRFGNLYTAGTDGFRVDAASVPAIEDAVDLALLDSCTRTSVLDGILPVLTAFETAFAAENQTAIAAVIAGAYNDGTRTSKAAYLADLADFCDTSQVLQFDLSNPRAQADAGTGAVTVTAGSVFTARQFTLIPKTVINARSTLPFYFDCRTVADRDKVRTVYRYKPSVDETVRLRLLEEYIGIILYVDRRPTSTSPWEEFGSWGAAALAGGVTAVLAGGYDHRFILANASSNQDPTQMISLEIVREANPQTRDWGGPQTFVFRNPTGAAWLITSTTVPPP